MRWLCFLAVCAGGSAQELGELSTERPGFTATSGAVGAGVLQLEQGSTLEWARESGTKTTTFTTPQALVRFGITSSLELRFSTNGYSWRGATSGANDSAVGVK